MAKEEGRVLTRNRKDVGQGCPEPRYSKSQTSSLSSSGVHSSQAQGLDAQGLDLGIPQPETAKGEEFGSEASARDQAQAGPFSLASALAARERGERETQRGPKLGRRFGDPVET